MTNNLHIGSTRRASGTGQASGTRDGRRANIKMKPSTGLEPVCMPRTWKVEAWHIGSTRRAFGTGQAFGTRASIWHPGEHLASGQAFLLAIGNARAGTQGTHVHSA